jgi:hypothetical protein
MVGIPLMHHIQDWLQNLSLLGKWIMHCEILSRLSHFFIYKSKSKKDYNEFGMILSERVERELLKWEILIK